jgi:polyisoprenoid-binding protein YceI
MKALFASKTLTVAVAVVSTALRLHAADGWVTYKAQPGSTVKMDGTSSIHDWTVIGGTIGGTMELDPAFDADLKTVKETPKVSVIIPVRQLKSQVAAGAARMDQVMQEHMNMKDHPRIEYKLLKLTPKEDKFQAEGELTISGVTRTNIMTVSFERVESSKIKVSGQTTVKMTDHGIKPPAPQILGMPTISTGDEVKLAFEWLTAKAK